MNAAPMPSEKPSPSLTKAGGSEPSSAEQPKQEAQPPLPSLNAPKGGGAIRSIGEKYSTNAVTGTGSVSIPVPVSPGRNGFAPQLALQYDSGVGHGPFGLGWQLSLPMISRKTDKGLPKYDDAGESDVYLLSGAEDLVPRFKTDTDEQVMLDGKGKPTIAEVEEVVGGERYRIRQYRPRTEGLFVRIERWTRVADGDIHWRSISKDNITTCYGTDRETRIADPAAPHRVFSWLICQSFDQNGQAMQYRYKREDSAGIDPGEAHEANRTATDRSAQLYPSHILYGNTAPLPERVGLLPPPDLSSLTWHFEVRLDYGEGYLPDPPRTPVPQEVVDFVPAPTTPWKLRSDPCSTRRSGFEIRTYRRCQRVLLVHHFATELGSADTLIGSLDLTYDDSPYGSALLGATHSGYVRQADGRYLRRCLPPVEFEYSRSPLEDFTIDNFLVQELDADTVKTLPGGTADTRHRWVDLDGEGLPGLLSDDGGHWYYRANRGEGSFADIEAVAAVPLGASLAGGATLLDLAGDGQLDLVNFDESVAGFYERREEKSWEPLRTFRQLPRLNWTDANLRFVDLTGDGHADVLLTEDDGLSWFESLAEEGFDAPQQVRTLDDESRGARLVFADQRGTVFLADMTGDGLSDLVRVERGQVCYWPNVGYGRFGARVVMADSPWFESSTVFDHRRLHFFDTDGSGPSDLVYESAEGLRIYLNQSGNRWSTARKITGLATTDSTTKLDVIDLLGRGTACLVRSSLLPADRDQPVRFIDVMNGVKPRLLTKIINNLGAETRIEYASSTKFYLDDLTRGTPWITRLPFPVHVVTRVESKDLVAGNRFVSTYSYHHGFFDGEEREFRGFGRVEQLDTEVVEAVAGGAVPYVPPVKTITWFHTGVFTDRARLSNHFEDEYFQETRPGVKLAGTERQKLFLPDTVLPTGLNGDEEREACRALRGVMLRQEVYSLDGGPLAWIPYSTTERVDDVVCLQRRHGQRHGVYFTHAREQLEFHYERRMTESAGVPEFDPRISHAMTLAVDAFGNVLRSVAIAYPRRNVAGLLPEQKLTHVGVSVARVVNRTREAGWYRTGLPVESRAYEWVNPPSPSNVGGRFGLLKIDTMRTALEVLFPTTLNDPQSTSMQPTRDWISTGTDTKLRLLSAARTLYRRDDLTSALPLGDVQSRALPYESYQLAFTPDVLDFAGGHITEAMLANARYVHSVGDVNWWVPGGRVFFSPGSADTPAQELAYAKQHFFLPLRFRDPFHTDVLPTESRVRYDQYDLLVLETTDALGNTVSAGERDAAHTITSKALDYRVLQARTVCDPNRNCTDVAFDALGMVVGTAVRGKPGETVGDSLMGFEPDLPEAVAAQHLSNPLDNPHALLGTATSRMVYDLFAWHRSGSQPSCVYSVTRETHTADLPTGTTSKVQHRYSYSDGFGREIQAKAQAEPGPVPGGTANPRWVGSGWTVFNNKGKPVRQFEPFFSATQRYERDVRIGVSATLLYDPLTRVVATLNPDHTWQKVVFDPWSQSTWDGNDTVRWPDPADATTLLTDPREDADVGKYFAQLPGTEFLPTWYDARIGGAKGPEEQAAAQSTEIHAGTPGTTHLDSLGRAFRTVVLNRFQYSGGIPQEETHTTTVQFDFEGRQRIVTDARGNPVLKADFDLLGKPIRQISVDAGTTYTLADISGKPIYSRDALGREFTTEYDQLRRPLTLRMNSATVLEEHRYGEIEPNPEAKNTRGKPVRIHDQSGVVETPEYDFKGNPRSGTRVFAQEFQSPLDWATAPALELDEFTSTSEFDALNRPVKLTHPDGSELNLTYNEGGLLETVTGKLKGTTAASTLIVSNIDHDAKGQRTRIDYGNGTSTTYDYDPLTYRLTRMTTQRSGFPGEQIQKLTYTYDAVGNITTIRDDAQQTVFFANRKVEPSNTYRYDSVYRLIEATGREHCGLTGTTPNGPTASDALNTFHRNQPHPGDGNALNEYLETYIYDFVGNFKEMKHATTKATIGDWTRTYDTAANSNRLLKTSVTGGLTETFSYDLAGNMSGFGHLDSVTYDHRHQLQTSVRSSGAGAETTHYVYDGAGQRTRKVTVDASGTKKHERRYIGGYEVYREYMGDGLTVKLERTTVPVMDDKSRIAMVEHRTIGTDTHAKFLLRYQHGNHLGTVSLELDDTGRIISYEEYSPYGSTTYQAMNPAVQAAAKRYRYTGKERDEETGFNYHSARYYAPWLGRWTTADPAGLVDGPNVYGYCRGSPLLLIDNGGTNGEQPSNFNRFLGGLKTVGGVLEMAAGASLVAAGAATSGIGVGVLIAGAGVLVAAHGADTAASGAATVWTGTQVDSFTSQGLQKVGLTRTQANLADAGISIVGTLGANLATRAPAVAAVATTEGASVSVSHAAGAPSIAGATNPLGYAIGHSRVGVNLGDGAGTVWSHLTVPGADRVMSASGALVESGTAVVAEVGTNAPKFASIVTIPVTAAEARAAQSVVTSSLGEAGNYALFSNDCASYAQSVLNAANISSSGATPATLFVSTALRSEAPLATLLTAPVVMQPVTAAGVAVNAGVAATSSSYENTSTGSTSTTSNLPDPNNFQTFDEYAANARGPYSQDYLMQQWANVRGWSSGN
jgi:RHS repeat-associated protein